MIFILVFTLVVFFGLYVAYFYYINFKISGAFVSPEGHIYYMGNNTNVIEAKVSHDGQLATATLNNPVNLKIVVKGKEKVIVYCGNYDPSFNGIQPPEIIRAGQMVEAHTWFASLEGPFSTCYPNPYSQKFNFNDTQEDYYLKVIQN